MIKAIETEYNGYKFRSRLEARWAVFLDSFNEEWAYEVEGYELPSGRYLPDFWLPRFNCWLEIKGIQPTELEETLSCQLARMTGRPVLLVWGLPYQARLCEYVNGFGHHFLHYDAQRMKTYLTDYTDSSGGEGWWDEIFWAIDLNNKLCICSNNDRERDFFAECNVECEESTVVEDCFRDAFDMKRTSEIKYPIRQEHVNKAKSARFEFKKSDKYLKAFEKSLIGPPSIEELKRKLSQMP